MRIPCPYCGERDSSEFSYLGGEPRPLPDTTDAPDAPTRIYEHVYLRDNIAGVHWDLWYHASGCRSWLRVRRDTRTHEIFEVKLAREVSGT
jgi:heterotetrameric sarcosine oxidase delta subunit